ncbi:MAG TPA: tetratricopeptide repeat protein, partial [Anaerolineales bacterium]|nr:tetratricopeptide repeat protein [Anaerolineales bacterium]
QEEDLWKKSFGQEPVPAASVRTEVSAPVNQAGDLPDWLQGVDKKTESTEEIEEAEDAAPWLHREKWEAEGVEQPKPTSPSDWHPITENADQKQSFVQPPTQTRVEVEKNAPEISVHSALKKKPSLAAKPRQPEAQSGSAVLNQAKGELDRGDIPAALDHYGKLIKKGKQLDETIRDLTDSLYRYPVEVSIWQTLGDAYMRANRLKEALESYNKAEELIR